MFGSDGNTAVGLAEQIQRKLLLRGFQFTKMPLALRGDDLHLIETGTYHRSHGIAPVSYTHLDVYKRQRQRNGILPIIGR